MDVATQPEAITTTLLKRSARSKALPKHFGRWMMKAEHTAFAVMEHMAPAAYKKCGGYWEFYETSNGGFFATPFGEGDIVEMHSQNGSTKTISSEAAGLVVWMTVCSHLSFKAHESDSKDMVTAFGGCFHKLREYALDHADANGIFTLLD